MSLFGFGIVTAELAIVVAAVSYAVFTIYSLIKKDLRAE